MRSWALRHPLFATVMTTYLMGTALQATPALVSHDADTYLDTEDYPEEISTEFNTENVRVYDRYNPLSSLHSIGRSNLIINDWDADESFFDNVLNITLGIPVNVLLMSISEFSSYLPSYTSLDAYAMPLGQTCYIKPPGQVNVENFIADLSSTSSIDDESILGFSSDNTELADALRAYVMAHELRHCLQNHDNDVSFTKLIESDADIKALNLISNSHYSSQIKEQVKTIVRSSRIVGSLGDSETHDTGLNIINENNSVFSTHLNGAAINFVSEVVESVKDKNDFPEDMTTAEQNYHAIKSLSLLNISAHFQQASTYIKGYNQAFLALDRISDTDLISLPSYYKKLNTSFLQKDLIHSHRSPGIS